MTVVFHFNISLHLDLDLFPERILEKLKIMDSFRNNGYCLYLYSLYILAMCTSMLVSVAVARHHQKAFRLA
jgi:uncharacterized protein (DUF608 family)